MQDAKPEGGARAGGGIVLDGVTKRFAGDVVAVDEVSLVVAEGEFMVLVGPSGCGKTTLLRMIAGLEEVTSGEIRIADRVVTHVSPKDRDVAMVFQNYALYPHMSVAQNMGFGLRMRRHKKSEISSRVNEAARILDMGELLDRRPGQLSGGQRQRVAMGRAIVRQPAAFLMDEPLSNLDAQLRVRMRAELARLSERLRTTTVYVTHDQVEAMTLGHRVAVLRHGVLQQVGRPQDLFSSPVNIFVAGFIGSPQMNLVRARVVDGGIEFGGFHLVPPERLPLGWDGRELVVGIRPSDMEDVELGHDPGASTIEVTAEVVEHLGTETHVLFTVDAQSVVLGDSGELEDSGSSHVPGAGALFSAVLHPGSRCEPHQRVRLAINMRSCHYFDAETGAVLDELDRGRVKA